jgi:sulfide dehydrogenase [flavocytochrome c] flavoprotein chain
VLNRHIAMSDLEVRYDALRDRHGVDFVIDTVTGLDASARELRTAGAAVSPTTADRLARHRAACTTPSRATARRWPRPGAQRLDPRRADGAAGAPAAGHAAGRHFVLAAPPNPYRCPPGPYERAALMVEWFQQHNPTAKVIIVDPKDAFVTDATMMLGWNRLYRFNLPDDYAKKIGAQVEVRQHASPGMLSWVRGSQGGRVLKLDAKAMRIETEAEVIQADVINIVPPMRAGRLAATLGLTDASGWCPVERRDFASMRLPHVHVIGDASIADAMPKSGFSANNQAKVVARAIVEELAGRPAPEPVWENTCYALAGKHYGLYVADVFRLVDGKIARINGAERFLPLDASPEQIRLGARYQQAWLRSFTQDVFA